jgi:hypothetical protein
MKRSIVLSGKRFWMKAVAIRKVARGQKKKKVIQKKKVKMVSSSFCQWKHEMHACFSQNKLVQRKKRRK